MNVIVRMIILTGKGSVQLYRQMVGPDAGRWIILALKLRVMAWEIQEDLRGFGGVSKVGLWNF